jgi:tricorn protease
MQGYYRYPTIAGDRIVFVCEDDLWTVPAAGGAATRLTASFGTCTYPRLSPDGAWLAFVSTDEGNPEVYVMPAGGGQPRRVTFLGGSQAMVTGWSEDSKDIFFVGNPVTWYEGETRPFAVAIAGGEPRELNLGHARSLAYGPNGALAIGRNANDPARWKRYRGGTAGEIWVDATGSGTFTLLALPNGNPTWPMWIADRIFFLSDHEGIGNIYSCDTAGGAVTRHSNESEYYVRFPSSDGTRIVYSSGGSLSLYDAQTDEVRPLDVDTPSAAPQTVRRFEDASESLEHFAPHPDGTRIAFVSRGQAFSMPLFDGAITHYGTGSRARTRLTEWLRDGKRFVCVSDANGYEQIVVQRADGSADPKPVTTGDVGRITELACSPTADVVAFANHRHELCVLDLEDAKVRVLDTSPAHRIASIAFSPDGRFLAYVWSPSLGTSIVRVAKVKSGKVHDITSPMRVDQSPAWDPEGNYLYFISTRDFNPVYDALQFDLSFPQASRPFVVTLRNNVPSPFVPKPKPVHRDHDHDHDRDDADKPDKTVDIDIDFEGIQGRVLGFPVDEGEYGQIVAVRERVLFTRFPVKGIKPSRREDREGDDAGSLHAYDFEHQRFATIVSECDEIRLGSDGRTLVYRAQERLRAIDALLDLPEEPDEVKPGSETGRKTGWIDLERASVEIVPRDEWAQMYREATSTGTGCTTGIRPCCRASARAANFPTSFGKCKGNSARRTPTRTAATIACLRNINADFWEPTSCSTRSAKAIVSNASIAATRGIANTILLWPNRAWTFAKVT